MNPSLPPDKSFRLGLTMAGAVSAGAYTGGVLDYLLQALDGWYKNRHRPDVPQHNISLDIISGASAGGITGAMAALVLHLEERYPVTPDRRKDEEYLKKNVFYNAWVNLTQDDMVPELLDLSDIEDNRKVVSLLNSAFVEKLAVRTITRVPECTTAPPPYVSKGMELILTLSNLEGFTYELNFSAEGASKYVMEQHRDYAFFRLGRDYGGDGRIPLNLQGQDMGLPELLQAAPATGAFPIGLAYRKFVRRNKYILDNKDLVYYRKGTSRIAGINENEPEGEYVSYNVDGGMLNNEPFDLTMKLMARTSPSRETMESGELKKEEQAFDSTIIMIDPFPSDDSISDNSAPAGEKKQEEKPNGGFPKFPFTIIEAVGKVFDSMRSELLFKGEDIVKAFTNEDFSRFMIAPSRKVTEPSGKEETYNGSVAIACGALGGFSGFLDKSFRQHDFYLGRANCQSFLRKYFRVRLENGVPVNPLFAAGYSQEAIERFKFQDPRDQKDLDDPTQAPWYVPIIPDLYQDDPAFDEKPPDYPVYEMSRLDLYRGALLKRLKIVARSLKKAWWYRGAVNLGFFFWGRSIYKALKKKIAKQLNDWNLLHGS